MKPQSLRAFIRQGGGLWEQPGGMTGELRHLRECSHGLVNRKTGRPIDRAREAAAEAGYLGPCTATAVAETTAQDLLDALYSNEPVYSVFDEYELHKLAQRRADREFRRAKREYSYIAETGLLDRAEDMMIDGPIEYAPERPLPKPFIAPRPHAVVNGSIGPIAKLTPIAKFKLAATRFFTSQRVLIYALGAAMVAVKAIAGHATHPRERSAA